jgi:hypothetical protein
MASVKPNTESCIFCGRDVYAQPGEMVTCRMCGGTAPLVGDKPVETPYDPDWDAEPSKGDQG